jgi:uncharacterized protein (TIGR00297 family)
VIRRLLVGSVISAAGSAAALRARALTPDGAIAAWAIGTSVISGTSWRGATVLGAFFVSSSALTRTLRRSGNDADDPHGRNARQVLANGGVAALAALATLARNRRSAALAFAGSLEAASADTVATEVGSTSASPPRLLISRSTVPPGTSGGMTRRGTLAAAGGSAGIALVALTVMPRSRGRDAVAVAIAGFGGSLADSIIGEFAQERRYCWRCAQACESHVHRCGSKTEHVGGVAGIDNDVVNLVATATGAAIALALGACLGQ